MARTELVIKIPQFIYGQILKCNVSKKTIAHIFKNGTPLDTHDEEVIATTVESIWGKPPYTEVLDKIRAEIKDWQVDIHDNEYDADKYDFVFERIFEIIDEYKTESEEV